MRRSSRRSRAGSSGWGSRCRRSSSWSRRKPLSFVGSQALVFLEPFVKAFLNLASYDRFTALMEDRKNVERLIRKIEELEDERARKEREEKAARRAAKGEREETMVSAKEAELDPGDRLRVDDHQGDPDPPKQGDTYRLLVRGEAPTTVEAPFEDVTRGVLNAIMEVEELAGRKILDGERIITPATDNGRGRHLRLDLERGRRPPDDGDRRREVDDRRVGGAGGARGRCDRDGHHRQQ